MGCHMCWCFPENQLPPNHLLILLQVPRPCPVPRPRLPPKIMRNFNILTLQRQVPSSSPLLPPLLPSSHQYLLSFQLPPLRSSPLTVMWWMGRRWSSMFVSQDIQGPPSPGTIMGPRSSQTTPSPLGRMEALSSTQQRWNKLVCMNWRWPMN